MTTLAPMSGINKVILLGSVEDHPVRQTSTDGSDEISFTLLTVEQFKKGKSKMKHIERHLINIAASHSGSSTETILKGDRLFLQGKSMTRGFTDKNNVKRYSTVIVVSNLEHFN